MQRETYLLRSMLFVPAYKERYIYKALTSNTDAIILDLEDSIPNNEKKVARNNIKIGLENGDFKDSQVFVRLNSLESEQLFEDLKYVIHPDIKGFMLSKIYTADDIIFYDNLITQLEKENGIPAEHFKFTPLIETTEAVMDVYNIAKSTKRNIAITFGGEDYLNDLEGLHGEPPRAFEYPRAMIALAARAAGILPIDTPYLSVKDFDGFSVEEKISKELGFAGCLLIHPEQIDYANSCFSPTEEQIKKSKEIVDAIELSKKKGLAVAMLGNKMIGPPMQKKAKKVLETVRLIQKKKGIKI